MPAPARADESYVSTIAETVIVSARIRKPTVSESAGRVVYHGREVIDPRTLEAVMHTGGPRPGDVVRGHQQS